MFPRRMVRSVSRYLADATMPGLSGAELIQLSERRERRDELRDLDQRMMRDLGIDRSAA